MIKWTAFVYTSALPCPCACSLSLSLSLPVCYFALAEYTKERSNAVNIFLQRWCCSRRKSVRIMLLYEKSRAYQNHKNSSFGNHGYLCKSHWNLLLSFRQSSIDNLRQFVSVMGEYWQVALTKHAITELQFKMASFYWCWQLTSVFIRRSTVLSLVSLFLRLNKRQQRLFRPGRRETCGSKQGCKVQRQKTITWLIL